MGIVCTGRERSVKAVPPSRSNRLDVRQQSTDVRIVPLQERDVDAVDRVLCAAYQTDNSMTARLRAYAGAPDVRTFVAHVDGKPAGFVAGMDYGTLAYIALMAVDPLLQRRRIGNALMNALVAWLDERGISAALEATPAGVPLYLRHGFTHDGETIVMDGEARAARVSARVRPYRESDREAILRADRAAFGADRSGRLGALLAEPGNEAFVGPDGAFVVAQRVMIGPLIAHDAHIAAVLFDAACAVRPGRRARVQVPGTHAAAHALALERGFAEVRRVRHMVRGPQPAPEAPHTLWARIHLGEG